MKITLTTILTLVIKFISPVIDFAIFFIIGLILQVIVGDAIADGLNLILDTQRFSMESIPIIAAILGTLCNVFRGDRTVLIEKDNDE